MIAIFDESDAEYTTWLLANPASYVVNMRRGYSPSYMVLHRSNCNSVDPRTSSSDSGAFTERDYVKVCSSSLKSLRALSKAFGRADGSFSGQCRKCTPGGQTAHVPVQRSPTQAPPIRKRHLHPAISTSTSSRSDLSQEDYAKLLARCQELPQPQGNYAVQSFLSNVILTVLDYQLQNTTVNRAHERFMRDHSGQIEAIYQLSDFLGRYPNDKQGNMDAAVSLWGYKYWTRVEQLRGLVDYFIDIGVVDANSLKAWAMDASFEVDFRGRIKGLGPAVFQWLIMRAGVDTIKPDVHIMQFVSTTLGHSLAFAQIIDALVRIANETGKTPRDLDLAIWEQQRGSAGQI